MNKKQRVINKLKGKDTEFLIMFQGKQLGSIKADDYKEARSRVEEVITIEEVEDE